MIREAITLTEKYIENRFSEKEWLMALQGALPLTPTLLKEWEKDVPLTYHTCSVRSLQRLIKLQGRNVDISTFTKGSEGIAQGIASTATILVELSGKASFGTQVDIHATVDRNGYKWLDEINYGISKTLLNKFTKKMRKKVAKYLGVKEPNTWEMRDVIVDTFDGKQKNKFIKWYYDEAKKLINYNLLQDIADDINNGDRDGYEEYNNNEILLHKFKIIRVRIIADHSYDEEEIRDELDYLKIKYGNTVEREWVQNIGKR